MKRIVRRFVFLSILLLAVLNVLAYHHAKSFFYYTDGGTRTPSPEALTWSQKLSVLWRGINIPKPKSHTSPVEAGLAGVDLRIPGRDGMNLSAWLISRTNASNTVILFHGYSSEKSGLLPEARCFWEMGYNVVMVDFPGSGDSPGVMTSLGIHESRDVAAVVAWARYMWPDRRLILYGHSMGGAAIMRAMAMHGVKPDAAIVESVFDTLRQAIRFRFELLSVPPFPAADILLFWGSVQLGANGFTHDVVDYARNIEVPVMIIHGANDRRASVAGARKVFEALPESHRWLLIGSAGHVNPCLAEPLKWMSGVRAFISSVP